MQIAFAIDTQLRAVWAVPVAPVAENGSYAAPAIRGSVRLQAQANEANEGFCPALRAFFPAQTACISVMTQHTGPVVGAR